MNKNFLIALPLAATLILPTTTQTSTNNNSDQSQQQQSGQPPKCTHVVSHWRTLPPCFRGSAFLSLRAAWSGDDVSLVWLHDRGNDRKQQDTSDHTQGHTHWQFVDV